MSSPVPRGATLLAEHLQRSETSVYAFAKQSGIPCDHLLKVVRGKRRRISVDLALDIETATGGAVPVASWRMKTPPSVLTDKRPTPNVCRSSSRATSIPPGGSHAA